MKYTFKDEDFVYAFDFKVNDAFVVPDDGAYTYKIRKADGTVLYTDDTQRANELEDNTSSSAPLSGDTPENQEDTVEPEVTTYIDSGCFTVPAQYNTLEQDQLFDSRIIEISFYYKGKPYLIRDSYRITDFYYFSASPKDVRDYYGLNEGELPDEDIDLTEVYIQLVQKHGDIIKECLATAGVGNLRVNRLIILKGVVQVFSSVRLRVNQEENDGSSKFIRYLNKIDWDALLDGALAEIEELENNLTGEEAVSYTDYTPFFLGAVRDAITGEEN